MKDIFDETPLQTIDKALNKFSPVLFTLFDEVRKDWKPGQHVTFKPKESDNTYKLYCTHSPAFRNTINLDDSMRRIDDLTLIMDLSTGPNKIVFYYKRFRNNPHEHTFITLNENSFTFVNSEKSYTANFASSPVKYPAFEKSKWWEERTELECFQKCSLVALEKEWFKNNNSY
jgi:hypothetical protein